MGLSVCMLFYCLCRQFVSLCVYLFFTLSVIYVYAFKTSSSQLTVFICYVLYDVSTLLLYCLALGVVFTLMKNKTFTAVTVMPAFVTNVLFSRDE